MADRYWVGGAGTWDATTTTNWSASSGGVNGASAPTSADNVIFDSASNATAYAVTVGTNANAADITIAGPLVGNVTITFAATSVINCYGSWLNSATGVVFTTTTGAILNFLATTTGKTVTTNNVTLGIMTVAFGNSSGGWTLGSAFTCTGTFTVTSGTFNTGANYAINAASYISSGGTFKSITLNSSTVTCTATGGFQIATTATNLTFSGASSTITCSNGSPTFGGISGLTYGTVQFTATATGTTTITGANTFTALSHSTVTSTGYRFVLIGADQTVSGTLTLSNGAAANRRMFVRSDTVGTPRTLTVATLAALVDVDFRDIVAAGASAASPWTGTRLGNCLGNTNITFGAGVNKYLRSVSGANANFLGTVWSTSSLDTAVPAVNDFPLPQDTIIIDDAGATANNGLRTGNTLNISDNVNIGTLDVSGRTTAFNWNQGNNDPVIYGNVTLSSSMTFTNILTSPTWTFAGSGLTQTLNSAGVTLPLSNFTIDSFGGTVSLSSNTTVELTTNATGTVILTQGTLSLGSYTFTAVAFSSNNSNTRTLAFGSGNITITGVSGTVFVGPTSTNTGLTITGTAQVNITGNGTTTRTVNPGNSLATSAPISFTISAGSDTINSTTGMTFNNLTFTSGFTGTFGNTTRSIFGSLTLNASIASFSSGASTLTFTGTGSQTITTAGETIDCPITFDGVGGTWAMQDALTLGSTRTLTFANGTLQLKAGTTSTVGSFATSGSTLKYLQSTIPGTQATISDASGTDTVSYLSIKDSNATGGAVFQAFTSNANVNAGNNTGWYFLNSVSFLPFF